MGCFRSAEFVESQRRKMPGRKRIQKKKKECDDYIERISRNMLWHFVAKVDVSHDFSSRGLFTGLSLCLYGCQDPFIHIVVQKWHSLNVFNVVLTCAMCQRICKDFAHTLGGGFLLFHCKLRYPIAFRLHLKPCCAVPASIPAGTLHSPASQDAEETPTNTHWQNKSRQQHRKYCDSG